MMWLSIMKNEKDMMQKKGRKGEFNGEVFFCCYKMTSLYFRDRIKIYCIPENMTRFQFIKFL